MISCTTAFRGCFIAFLFCVSLPMVASASSEAEWIRRYLLGFSTMVADFVQDSSDASSEHGKLFLSKGAKLKIKYDSIPIEVVVRGNNLAFRDLELGNVSYYTTDYFDFFARGYAPGSSYRRKGGFLSMSFSNGNKNFLVVFSMVPARIVSLKVIEQDGSFRMMRFANVKHDIYLSDSIFE